MNEAQTGFAKTRAVYEMACEDARNDPRDVDISDEECELLGRAQSESASALFLTPAPDLAALAYKLEAFAAEDCFSLSPPYREPLFAALIADVRRLGELQ